MRCLRAAALATVAALAIGAVTAQPTGPAVAIEAFTGNMLERTNAGAWVPNPDGPRGVSSLLISDLTATKSSCDVRLVEWLRRGDAIREIQRGTDGTLDPATAPAAGQLVQPDVFVRGTVNGTETTLSWDLQLVTGVGGTVIGTIKGSAPIGEFGTFTEKIAQQVVDEVCKKGVGYALNARIGEMTIHGTICGDLDKRFTATSPEIRATWDFVPGSANAGTFTYTAADVGGVTGSGKGTYTVVRAGDKAVSLKLAGTGSIHSPLGTFSAPMNESLPLTPVKTCGRVGNE